MPSDLTVAASDGASLSVRVEQEGERAAGRETRLASAPPIVLLHGLTATRRYVVMGSRLLERSGATVVSYDARGHGESTPAPARSTPAPGESAAAGAGSAGEDAYGYRRLTLDLVAVLDALAIERAVLAGASMGAHTIARLALERPERVAALALITPAYDADRHRAGGEDAFAGWDALAAGLRGGGVEGFVAAYDFSPLPPAWRATVEEVVRQRLAAHAHPDAVADALEAVPRSRPFEQMAELARIAAPTVVVGDRDEADPGHPLAVAERYAELIPQARLVVEQPGASPLAWQGGQLSRALADLAASVAHPD